MDLTVYREFERFFIENHPSKVNNNLFYVSPWQWCRDEETFKKYLQELYFNIYSFDWIEVVNFFGIYEKIDYIYELDLGYSRYWHMFINFLILDNQISYDLIIDLIKSTTNLEQIKLYKYPERLFYREMNSNNRNTIKRKMSVEEPMDKRMKFN